MVRYPGLLELCGEHRMDLYHMVRRVKDREQLAYDLLEAQIEANHKAEKQILKYGEYSKVQNLLIWVNNKL